MIDFLKARWICAAGSVLILVLFVGGALYKYKTTGSIFEYAIDFTGGTQALLKFDKNVSAKAVGDILKKASEQDPQKAGWKNCLVRDFSEKEIAIRVKEVTTDSKGLAETIREVINKAQPDNQAILMSSESVSESVGSGLRWNSVLAVILAMLAILLYIAFRFRSMAFGMGAVVALLHDTVVMLGACMFLNIEISMTVIASILALLGYSNNDTIVNFAQIRKNLKLMHGTSIYDIINISVNQMLRRTIRSSLATALPVTAMLIWGGEVLRDFSIIFLIGIIFGTYSSIYIASPIIMWFHKEK